MTADINPLLSAVKNDEPSIGNPENKNENENIVNPYTVMLNNSSSYPTKALITELIMPVPAQT